MVATLTGIRGEYQGRTIPIEYDRMIIGRESTASIRLSDISVSRLHAILRIHQGDYYLQDTNSTGGVYINGVRTAAQALQDGDQIQIGSDMFQFSLQHFNPNNAQPDYQRSPYLSNQPSNNKRRSRVFSMNGRNNRSKYFWTNFGFSILANTLSFGLGFIIVDSGGDTLTAQLLAFVFISIPLMFILAFNSVKRLHDLDRPGSHYWYLLIPFYGFYIALVLLFQKGTTGENQYGPDPCK